MRNITVNGRIAADVSRQISKQGSEFISFSLGNNEFGDPKSSDGKPQTQWFRVTAFQPQLVNMAQYLKKGKPIIVTGRYSNRLYQSQTTGQWGVSNEIIATDIAFEIGGERTDGQGRPQQTTPSPAVVEAQAAAVEDIPQVTSRQWTPQPQAAPAVDNGHGDDDLPF